MLSSTESIEADLIKWHHTIFVLALVTIVNMLCKHSQNKVAVNIVSLD